jgi:hypothetical protein
MQKNDFSFVSSVMGIYDKLDENGITLVYIGKFHHKITKMFTALTSDESDINNDTKSVKRKLHHTVVETLQNMTKHSSDLFTDLQFGKGIFMLGKKNFAYYIYTSNKVEKSDQKSLTETIELLNSKDKEELKEMYKNQLREGVLSGKGGAGLGLIDIVRKTGNKLGYMFIPIDDKYSYFVLRVKIDSDSE